MQSQQSNTLGLQPRSSRWLHLAPATQQRQSSRLSQLLPVRHRGSCWLRQPQEQRQQQQPVLQHTTRLSCSSRGRPLTALSRDMPLGGAGDEAEAATSLSPGGWLSSPFDKEIFALAIPALFSVLLDPMMGMVDTAIVGRLGTEPLAAVGLATVVFNMSCFVWNFLLYATTPRIAAAVSQKDSEGVSKITSQSLWLAGVIGVAMMCLLWVYCPRIFALMGGKPAVVAQAVPYMRGRCIAHPSIMAFYVMSGCFRGFKDTMTPLWAGILSNIVHLGLDVVLVFGLGWGVVGAALATSLSHWVTTLVLGTMIISKGYLRVPDLLRPPSWAEIVPMLHNGFHLSTRSMLAMLMLLWSTKLIAGFGAVALAAHEILRQVWVLSNQAFTCLDIATQSLIAFYLGRGDKRRAAAVFSRVSQLALVASVVVTSVLLLGRSSLPAVFTNDAAVMAQVAKVMPLIALYLPLDAIASVMDGVLLGSQQASWMSRTMVATSAACYAALLAAQSLNGGLLAIWGAIKFLTLGRCIGNSWRLLSPDGPLGHIRQGRTPGHAAS